MWLHGAEKGHSANDVLSLEIAAAGTQYEAEDAGQQAFETLMDGDQWMIYKNTKTNVLHWDNVGYLPILTSGCAAEVHRPAECDSAHDNVRSLG